MNKKLNEDILDKLKELALNSLPVFVWGLDGDQVVKAQVKLKRLDLRRQLMHFSFEALAGLYLSEIIHTLAPVNFYAPEIGVIFSGSLREFSNDLITCDFPNYYQILDKRKSERIEPLIPLKIDLNVEKLTIKDCFDISEGGFSLILPFREQSKLKLGDNLEKLKIHFLLKTYDLIGEVVAVKKIKPYEIDGVAIKGSRISVKLIEPSEEYKVEVRKMLNGQKKLLGDLES